MGSVLKGVRIKWYRSAVGRVRDDNEAAAALQAKPGTPNPNPKPLPSTRNPKP